MNGAKEFDQTINAEGHRLPRNATMLAQQLTNMGYTGVKAKWTITIQADAPDGSGRMTKSIVGTADKFVSGNGPSAIGGNNRTSLDDALASSGTTPAKPPRRSSRSRTSSSTPSLPGAAVGAGGSGKPSAFDGDDDD